jgi:5-methylcytosine-specific restriction endonuclease McrA
MALQRRDKKYEIKLPVCKWCGAIAKHHSWQCPQNPKNKCKYCGSPQHTSLMCQKKPRRPLKQEAEKTKDKRTTTSRLWFELNPPNERGLWFCYLRISPMCPVKLTRSTIQLEHVKPKVRYPELAYEVTNLQPACGFCNKLKGSWELHQLPKVLGTIRLPEDTTWDDILASIKQRA